MDWPEFRDRVELACERWARLMMRWRWQVVVVMLAISGALAAQFPQIRIETSIESFLLEDDPTLLVYNEFRDRFERDDRLIILIEPPQVFSFPFLEKLRAFHEELEREVPQLDDVDSLINARETRGEGDELIVEDLFETWPEDEAALQRIAARARENAIYPNTLLSEDYRHTALSLKLDTYTQAAPAIDLSGFEETESAPEPNGNERHFMTGEESIEAMKHLREVVARYQAPDFSIYMAGAPIVTERLTLDMTRDMRRFLGLAVLTTLGFLYLLFHRLSGMLLPVGVVFLSLIGTLGLTPALDIPIQVPTQVLPAFLMSVGVADSVHILAIFYQRLREGAGREEAIAYAFHHSGLPVIITSLTTAGGLISFWGSGLRPINNLGIIAPIGVMFALLFTMTLLPALLSIVPAHADRTRGERRLRLLDRVLLSSAVFSTKHPVSIIVGAFLIMVVSLIGAAQLRFSHNPIKWFREGAEVRVGMDRVNKDLKGAVAIEVLLDTGRENGLHDPSLLQKVDELERYNAQLRSGDIFVGKTLSIVDILKEIHQALNENRADYYRLPERRELVAQELLLFENSGSDDLEDVTDSLFRTGRMTLRMPWVDAIAYPPMMRDLEAHYREVLGPGVGVTITGLMPLLSRTFEAVITSMARSYVTGFLVIAPLMIVLLGSFRMGLISMIPNVLPMIITLGIMGVFGIPLDGFTLLCGSIGLGLAVDDTVHFMHGFRRGYEQTGNAFEAVREVLATSGQAIFINTLVLCTGFFIFMLGDMQSTSNFGFITGLALAVAFVCEILLSPALVVLTVRWRERGRGLSSEARA